MEPKNDIIPCLNSANETMQPVRLRYKILDGKQLEIKVNTIKCIKYCPNDEDLIHWKFTDEVLKIPHGMTMPPPPNDFWLLGKLEITQTEVLIMVNSVQRALLALTFFDMHFGRDAIRVESLDICNELYKNSQQNSEMYIPIQKYFKGKVFGKGAPLKPLNKAAAGKTLGSRLNKANYINIIDKIKCVMNVSYENKEIDFYEKGIDYVRDSLKLHQMLSLIHLQHDKKITILEFLTLVIDLK
ncbi:MAG: hypothetical protein RI894_628 [Bacteroidota bacterium]|jgi:hypothetical protein